MILCMQPFYFTGFNNFTLQDIYEYITTLWKYIRGLIDFLFALPDIVFTMFPFLTVEQVEFMIFLIVALVVLCCYFIAKKVV